jgi:hypothetical protein
MKPITRLTLAALLTTAVFGTAVADTDFGTCATTRWPLSRLVMPAGARGDSAE